MESSKGESFLGFFSVYKGPLTLSLSPAEPSSDMRLIWSGSGRTRQLARNDSNPETPTRPYFPHQTGSVGDELSLSLQQSIVLVLTTVRDWYKRPLKPRTRVKVCPLQKRRKKRDREKDFSSRGKKLSLLLLTYLGRGIVKVHEAHLNCGWLALVQGAHVSYKWEGSSCWYLVVQGTGSVNIQLFRFESDRRRFHPAACTACIYLKGAVPFPYTLYGLLRGVNPKGSGNLASVKAG